MCTNPCDNKYYVSFTSDIKFTQTVSHIAFESQTRLFDVFVHVSHNISIPHAEKPKLTKTMTYNLCSCIYQYLPPANDEKVTNNITYFT